jgi:hypothetical protein
VISDDFLVVLLRTIDVDRTPARSVLDRAGTAIFAQTGDLGGFDNGVPIGVRIAETATHGSRNGACTAPMPDLPTGTMRIRVSGACRAAAAATRPFRRGIIRWSQTYRRETARRRDVRGGFRAPAAPDDERVLARSTIPALLPC